MIKKVLCRLVAAASRTNPLQNVEFPWSRGFSALLAALGPGVLPPCLISLLGTLPTPCGVCRLVSSTVAMKRRYLQSSLTACADGASFIGERRVMHSSVCGRISTLHGPGPSQGGLAAVRAGHGYAFRAPSVTWRITARHAATTTLASRRSHEQGRLKQPRLVYKSTISADHPRCSRGAGIKPILEI